MEKLINTNYGRLPLHDMIPDQAVNQCHIWSWQNVKSRSILFAEPQSFAPSDSIMRVIITQSNYIPWKGYFDNLAKSDIFVIYDDMQYTRRDWRNRNYIKTERGLNWLTIPVEVKGKFHQSINQTRTAECDWNISHLRQIEYAYKKAPFFSELRPWIEALYQGATQTYLTEINLYFIKAITDFLGIKITFRDSREFDLAGDRTERLVSICKELGATSFLTGPAAKSYMNEDCFARENIEVEYSDYQGYSEYPQLHPPFEHGVSILDLILNTGRNASHYLKYAR